MSKAQSKTLIKVFLHLCLLILAYILQALLFTHLPLFGVKPLIIPLFVAGAALLEGAVPGGTFGLFAGILCDVSFNQPAIQFTLLLTAVGLIVGMLSETVIACSLPSYLLCSLGVLLLSGLVQMFGLLFFGGASFVALLGVLLLQTLYSMFFTVPVYYLIQYTGKAF